MKGSICGVILLITLSLGLSSAEEGKVSGYMFGDLFWIASNHDADLEDQNGIWFRRIYFTYDRRLNRSFDVRFRLEMNSPGDFKTKAKLVPYVKDAFLRWRCPRGQLLFGISPTPTWRVIEKVWGYRSVEKTPLDLQKFGHSRDFGLAWKGKIPRGRLRWHLMVANGAGNSSETNKGKKVLFSLGLSPIQNLILELYADYDDLPGDSARYTLQAFLGYRFEPFRFGVQFAQQTRKGEGDTLEIVSVFGVLKIQERLKAILRIDHIFDPNPQGEKVSYLPFDPSAKSTFFLLGLDFTPKKSIHIIPNLEVVSYSAEGDEAPDMDIVPRLTFYYKF